MPVGQLAAWEEPLVEAALAGLSGPAAWAGEGVPPEVVGRSFAACAAITARHSRTFHLASALLPRAKRRAIRALYAFCRCTDDLVDRPDHDAPRALAAWREASLGPTPDLSHPVVPAFTVTCRDHHIPVSLAEALINAAVTGVFTPTARWDYFSQPREMRLASEKERPLYQGNRPMVY